MGKKNKRDELAANKQGNRPARARGERRRVLFSSVAILALFIGAYTLWHPLREGALGAGRVSDDPALGPETAPVTIVEYGDFGCSACKAWH